MEVHEHGGVVAVEGPNFWAEDLRFYRGRLRRWMTETEVGAVLLRSPDDVWKASRWMSEGTFAETLYVLTPDGPPLMVAREMERFSLSKQVDGLELVSYVDSVEPADAIGEALRQVGVASGRVGVDKASSDWSWNTTDRLRAMPVDWVDATVPVRRGRLINGPRDLECVRRAARFSPIGLATALAALRIGVTEREVRQAALTAMLREGSDQPAFLPFVRFGPDAVMEEHRPAGDIRLEWGMPFVIELSGACHRGHAPMSVGGYFGEAPDDFDERGEVAVEALQAECRVLRSGVRADEVHAEGDRVIVTRLGRQFSRHHWGYGYGPGCPPGWVGNRGVFGLRDTNHTVVEEGQTFHLMFWLLVGGAMVEVSAAAVATPEGGRLLTEVRKPMVIPSS
jgi:Xaa-Pro aminopeptidase